MKLGSCVATVRSVVSYRFDRRDLRHLMPLGLGIFTSSWCWQRRHGSGLTAITPATSATGPSARVCPSWPGSPPGSTPARGRGAIVWAFGAGPPRAGWEGVLRVAPQPLGQLLTVAFNGVISARSWASVAACAKIIACATGGVRSHISGGKGGQASIGL